MDKCRQEKAHLDLQVKILIQKLYPQQQENQALTAQVKQLQKDNLKLQVSNYVIGLAGLLAIFVIARRAFRFHYKKELELEFNKIKYEERSETKVGPSHSRPTMEEEHRENKIQG